VRATGELPLLPEGLWFGAEANGALGEEALSVVGCDVGGVCFKMSASVRIGILDRDGPVTTLPLITERRTLLRVCYGN